MQSMSKSKDQDAAAARAAKEWARCAVLALLARLLEQLRLGRELPDEPWSDTEPDVRRGDEG